MKTNEKKVATKSESKRATVQKKPVAKKVEVKAVPKKSLDEIAFDKLMAKDPSFLKRCGKSKLLALFLAGVKRGKASK